MSGGGFIYSMEMTITTDVFPGCRVTYVVCACICVCVFLLCANVPAVSLMVIYCFAAQGLFYSPLHLFDHMLV